MSLGFDGQLPLLLLLKDGVGTGESVHGGGTGVLASASPAPLRNFPGCPQTPPLPLLPPALPMELLTLLLFCICQQTILQIFNCFRIEIN